MWGAYYKRITVLFKIYKYRFYFYAQRKTKDIAEMCPLVISGLWVNTLCSQQLQRRLFWKVIVRIPQEGQRITQDWGELWPAATALVSYLQQQTGP